MTTARLQSQWEGAGDTFTLIVGVTDDGIDSTPDEYYQWKCAFERRVGETLALDYGYDHVTVETVEASDAATHVAAKSARGEWEMADTIGRDAWDDICTRASEDAWDDITL